MSTVLYDSLISDDERRTALYGGKLFVFSPRPSSLGFCEFSRELIRSAFGALDPLTAQRHMPVEQYAEILSALKPQFIHHPRSKEFIRAVLADLGCDLAKTYFDVPRMRTSTSDGYLTSGIAYAFHPHRDTWYSAPMCQLNWWIPIYDIREDNCMAFHPRYWDQPVRNGSKRYNYQEWNKESRQNAAKHVKVDTREQPKAEESIELVPQVRLLVPVGGIIAFSAAQLHSSVPNSSGVTRFSIDFRTVHLDDAQACIGAPNIDSACTGTTMNDYLRGTDLSHIPDEIVSRYMPGHP